MRHPSVCFHTEEPGAARNLANVWADKSLEREARRRSIPQECPQSRVRLPPGLCISAIGVPGVTEGPGEGIKMNGKKTADIKTQIIHTVNTVLTLPAYDSPLVSADRQAKRLITQE